MASLPDRPKALTDNVRKVILDAVRLGMHLHPSCELAGIDYKTLVYWRNLVESGVEHAQVYADFFQSLKMNAAFSEGEALARLKNGAPSWQAQAWFLERRFPKRWRMKKDDPPPKDVANLSDEELEQLAKGKGSR